MILQKISKPFIALTIQFFLLSPFVYASSEGTSAFNFLKINPAARTAAMGDISSVITSQSLLVNPAILPWLRGSELSVQHLAYVSETSYSLLSYVQALDRNRALSLSLGYLGMQGLTRTVADSGNADGYSEQGNFDYSDTLVNIAYGQKVTSQLSYGASVKAVRETIDGHSTTSGLGSFSAYYAPRRAPRIAVGVINIGPQVSGYDAPMAAYAGMSKVYDKKFMLAGELVGYLDKAVALRLGGEYNIGNTVFLRAGYRTPLRDEDLGDALKVDLTAGLGFVFDRFSLDYAWVPYGDLGDTHRISLTWKIGDRFK